MNAPDAIRGTFCDFRPVKGRKVVQIVVEAPIEQADEVLAALGGFPQPDAERWVAIARLYDASARQEAGDPRPNDTPEAGRSWADLQPSQQAALRGNDVAFLNLIRSRAPDLPQGGPMAKEIASGIREICGVTSRADLNDNPRSRELWLQLDQEFLVWSGRARG